jgi:hypothetical protein
MVTILKGKIDSKFIKITTIVSIWLLGISISIGNYYFYMGYLPSIKDVFVVHFFHFIIILPVIASGMVNVFYVSKIFFFVFWPVIIWFHYLLITKGYYWIYFLIMLLIWGVSFRWLITGMNLLGI